MAVVTETIGSGKDRATVTLWEANVGNFGTDIYKGVISTNDNFDESVTLAGGSGSPNANSYLWLTTDPANRHSGVAGTGHGRMVPDNADGHIILVDAARTRIDWLELGRPSGAANSSDEGIRVQAERDDCLIDYCIIWNADTAADMDGIYLGNWNCDRLRISNTIMYGWTRTAIALQQYSSTPPVTHDVDIDHVTIINVNTDNDIIGGAIFALSRPSSAVHGIPIYNSAFHATNRLPLGDGSQNNNRTTPSGTVTWSGSNNADESEDQSDIDGTNNMTSFAAVTDGLAEVTKSTGEWMVYNDITAGSENLLLLDEAAGNKLAGGGTNRIGSEPDARQDFSVDILGNVRPTTGVDIGAAQFTTSDSPATVTPDEVAAVVAMPGSTPVGAAVDVQGTNAAVVAVPQATPVGAAVAEPGVIAAVVATPDTTEVGPAVPLPGVLGAIVAVPQATPVCPTTVTPGVLAVPVDVLQATATNSDSAPVPATVTPDAVAALSATPAAIPVGSAVVTPGVIAAVVATPAGTQAGAAVATHVTLAATTDVPQATPSCPTTVTPGVLAAIVASGVQGAGGGAGMDAIAAVIGVDAPTLVGAAIALPATLAAVAGTPGVGLVGGAKTVPNLITVTSTVSNDAPAGKAKVEPGVIVVIGDVLQATTKNSDAAAGAVVTPGVIAAVGDVPQAGAGVGASALTIISTVSIPSGGQGTGAQAQQIECVVVMTRPIIRIGGILPSSLHSWDDALMRDLILEGTTSADVVGALNEFNGTEGIGYRLARRVALDIQPNED